MNKILIGIVAILVLVGMVFVAIASLDNSMTPPDPIDPDPTDPDPDPSDEIKTYDFSTVGYPDDTDDICRGCFDTNPMWLGFRIPDNSKVTRVSGQIYMNLLGNNPCEVWFDIWDKCSQQYIDAAYVIDVSYIHDGWVTVDFTIPEQHQVNTYWIGFAGCHYYGDVTEPYNLVTEFTGTIYYKETTDCSGLSILSILNPFRDLTPSSPSSCNTC